MRGAQPREFRCLAQGEELLRDLQPRNGLNETDRVSALDAAASAGDELSFVPRWADFYARAEMQMRNLLP